MAEPTPFGPLVCYRLAQDETMLSAEDSYRLCGASRSSGPIDCYESAQDQTSLSADDSIALCRCAPSAAPVQCYLEGTNQTNADARLLLSVCAPTRRALAPGCATTRAPDAAPPP